MVTDNPAPKKNSSQSDPPSVADLIHRHMDELTPAERKVARALLANYPVAGLEPLAEFANQAKVSHPSVLRFVSKLGLQGYGRFQSALRAELGARLESPLTKMHEDGVGKDVEHDTNSDFLDSFVEGVCDNIRQSVASSPRSEFEGALKLLADTRGAVYMIGGRMTDAIASYTYMHLRMLRPRVHHVKGTPASWAPYLLDMDTRSVVIVFDIRRYDRDVIRFAEEAADQGAHIILVTDHWLSPIASRAEHLLASRVSAPSSWDSMAAMITFMEALIAALNNRNWDQLKNRIRMIEEIDERFENDGQKTE